MIEAVLVVFGSGMFMAGFAGYDASHADVDMPVVFNDRCPVLPCLENCGFSTVPALRQGRRHACRDAEAVFHGPDYSADHGDFPVALGQGGRCPCLAGCSTYRCRL